MANTELSLCARCAAAGRTCCQDTQIFLTRGDIARLRDFGENDFHEVAPASEESYSLDFAYDPVWSRIFDAAGRRRVIRHQAGGDCHFLTRNGCRLAPEVRPLVCRLYPYDYNHVAVKGVHGHLCPHPEAANPPLLLAVLGMNRELAETWRKELYRDITEEFPDEEDSSLPLPQ